MAEWIFCCIFAAHLNILLYDETDQRRIQREAAEDYLSESLDFNRDLIKHPEATFYAEVDGDSMTGLGINPGDIAVIDKSLEPAHGDIIVSYINEEFNIKQLDLTHQKEGYIELRSYNPKYPTFRINEDDHFRVWGVVVYTIKKWK